MRSFAAKTGVPTLTLSSTLSMKLGKSQEFDKVSDEDSKIYALGKALI
jgi:hypothetical protein